MAAGKPRLGAAGKRLAAQHFLAPNREPVKLESLKQTRDYFAMFPHPEWGTGTERAMNEVLCLASEKPKESRGHEDSRLRE
jgi:hypothetical protein